MPELRSIDWEKCAKAIVDIIERPFAEKGYHDLCNFYSSSGMQENFDSVDFLIKEKFHAHDTNPHEK